MVIVLQQQTDQLSFVHAQPGRSEMVLDIIDGEYGDGERER
jgi:hypothetical protein